MYHNLDGAFVSYSTLPQPQGASGQTALVHHGMMMRIIETTLLNGKHRTHLPAFI